MTKTVPNKESSLENREKKGWINQTLLLNYHENCSKLNLSLFFDFLIWLIS